MHIFRFEQEGGVGLTLGCREGAGHQRARSSCGQEEREGDKTTYPVGHSPSLFCVLNLHDLQSKSIYSTFI